MAAEYSRELGVKVLAGQKRVAALGFRVGGYAGFGLRRMLVSADRQPKKALKQGDRKALATDRVILVPGPAEEVSCVRQIYQMVAEKKMSYVAIAQELNRQHVPGPASGPWTHYQVRKIVTNPKYKGTVIYGRVSKRLRTPEVRVAPHKWIVVPHAFAPVVTESTYDEAQRVLANRTMNKSNEQLLDELRTLLAKEGKLTSRLINSAPGAALARSYRCRFGSVGRAYELIGYQMPNRRNVETRRRMQHIRLRLLHELQRLFPENIEIVGRRGHSRKHLVLNGDTRVSVLACNCLRSPLGHLRWRVRVGRAENGWPALLLLMNSENDDFREMYLLPATVLPPVLYIAGDSRILTMGERLPSPEAFLDAFDKLAGKQLDKFLTGALLRARV